jgi:hypothetical protein
MGAAPIRVATKAVVLGQLRNPGGCLVTLAVHQREIEEGTRRFPHQGPGRPRAVFSRFGVDLRIPIEQRTDVYRDLRGRRLWLAADVAGMQLPGLCCVGRSRRPTDWCDDVVGLLFCVRWLPLPAGGDLPRGPLVPALWPVLPRRRGAAGRARHHRRSRHHLPLGPALHSRVHRSGTVLPACSR